MTDYGRGSGSEPWHPEDPLFGDAYEQGYQEQEHQGQGYPQQPPHPDQPQQQPQHGQPQHPQQPQQQQDPRQQPQPGGWQDPYAGGEHRQYPPQGGYPQQHQPQQPPRQQYPQGGYDGSDGYGAGAYQNGDYGRQDPYGGHQPHDPYGAQQDYYGQNGYPPPQQPQYRQPPQGTPQQAGQHQPQPGMPDGPQQGRPQQPGMRQGAYQGTQQQPGGPDQHPQDQYPQDQYPQDPYPQGQHPQDQYPQQGRPQEPGVAPLRTAPEETGSWDAGADGDPREHAFFSGHDDDDDDHAPPPPGSRRAGKSPGGKGGRKRRSGCACLIVAVVLAGGLGGATYFGYSFYESHFGPAPDYSGQGAGDVQIEVPTGASLNTIGNILKQAGVVKSVDAFSAAANKNPKGRSIQAGSYILHRQMAASAAVTMMLDPTSQNAMIIPEGLRATATYARIDDKLGLKKGATAADVKNVDLGLPAWAHGNVEGFLFPSKYSVGKGMKPVDLVKEMVNRAKAEYTEDGLEDGALKVGRSPADILNIASLVQAEAQEKDDFGKVSRVIYNRLAQNTALGFDSTINYAKGRSTLTTTVQDTQYASPYNTYVHKGLPPGPIDSPGHQAIEAALAPTPGDWLYFVTVKPGDTRFTSSYAEHQRNVADFNAYQKEHGG